MYVVISACVGGEVFVELCTAEKLETYCKQWEEENGLSTPVKVFGPDDPLPEQFNDGNNYVLVLRGRIVSIRKGVDYVPTEVWRFE